jgi:peroxiredoxin
MASDLAALQVNGDDQRPVPIVVTTGNAHENERLARQHGINCPLLIQERMEIASLFRVTGTPMGYLIDERGLVASALAIGAQSVLALAALPGGPVGGPTPYAAIGGWPMPLQTPRGNRPLSESRINRSGLKAGTPAPGFRLPRIGGGELSLEQYRGQQVLLVFSDPHCGPCQEIAPILERTYRTRRDLQVVMISRGDDEENRRKIHEHRLSFPVLLQRQWEISRLYGMFATPIAYLIDKDGVLVADVAAGGPAIMELISVWETSVRKNQRSARKVPLSAPA